MRLITFLFSPKGQISRWPYVTFMGVWHLLVLLVAALLAVGGLGNHLALDISYLLFLWPAACVTLKRLSHMGLSAHWIAVPALAVGLAVIPLGLGYVGLANSFVLLAFGVSANLIFWGFQAFLALMPGRAPATARQI